MVLSEFARLKALATSRSSTESGVRLKLAACTNSFNVFATTNSWRLSMTSLSSTGGCKLNSFVTCF